MEQVITLELPWPPSVNHYYRIAGSKVFIGKSGREFRDRVYQIVKSLKMPKLCGRVSMTIDMYPPDLRRRDTDNILKALQDALTHSGVWNDDFQVWETHIYRREPMTEQGGVICLKLKQTKEN